MPFAISGLDDTLSYTEDTPLSLPAIVITDDVADRQITVRLSLSDPSAGVLQGSFGSLTELGLVDFDEKLNVILDDLRFVPSADWNQDVSINYSFIVEGQVITGSIVLNGTAVNDAPVVSAPEGVRLPSGTPAAITGISFSDIDAGPALVAVSMRLTAPPSVSLELGPALGLTLTTAGSTFGLTGDIATLNAYIAGGGLNFSAPLGFAGEGVLEITIHDNGATGSGGERTDYIAVALDIGGQNALPEGEVSITGEVKIGGVLTADVDLTDADGLGDFSYQWRADGAPIPDAEDVSLTITPDLAGKTISVTVSYRDLFGVEESVDSSGREVPGAPDPEPEPVPTPVTENVHFGAVPGTIERFVGPGLTPFQTLTVSAANVPEGAAVDLPIIKQFEALIAQISQGWGMKATGPDSLKSGASFWSISGPTLGLAEQDERFKKVDEALQRAIDKSAGLDPQRQVAAQKLTPEVLAGFNPMAPLVISGGATPNAPFSAVTIDARLIEMAGRVQAFLDAAIALQNIQFAFIQGAARIIGGAGAQLVFGDDARQSIILGEGDDELHGGGGDDTVGSESGNDSLFGDEGSDTVFGGVGDDEVFGGADADTAHGNAGNDLVHGNQGDDLIYGGQGDDVVRGGQGDDVAFGDLGNDLVFGDLGDDRLEGGQGDDALQGGQGSDTLHGGDGADVLRGGRGDDRLEGGDGNDALSGDLGDDVLTGGAGADTFLLFAGAGFDRITDFTSADRVVLAEGLSFALRQEGADTIVDLGEEGRLVLTGVQYSLLPEGWLAVV